MALKIRTSKAEHWVTYERGEDKARFLVAPMTPAEGNKLLEKRRQNEWDRGQRFEKLDTYNLSLDRVCAIIIDWDGLLDEEGKAFPCTRENKITLYQHEKEMIDWVLDQADKVAEAVANDGVEIEKNSRPGRSK